MMENLWQSVNFCLVNLMQKCENYAPRWSAYPWDKKDFTPHPKSMPLSKLAPHVAELAGFGLTVLTTPELDFSKGSYKSRAFESTEQLVGVFDEGVG